MHQDWIDQITDDHPNVMNVVQGSRSSYDDDMAAFLCFMAVRLLAMHRVLKSTGSIYLHCDPTASHYLKGLMDAIFGMRNFRNEVIWKRTSSHNRAKRWGPIHGILLFYSKGGNSHGIASCNRWRATTWSRSTDIRMIGDATGSTIFLVRDHGRGIPECRGEGPTRWKREGIGKFHRTGRCLTGSFSRRITPSLARGRGWTCSTNKG